MLVRHKRVVAVVVILSGLALTMPCRDAFAQPRRGGDYRGDMRGIGPGRESRMWSSGDRHYYRDGRWYRRGWFGFDIIVSALAIGALIDSLPPRYNTIVAGGVPYYYYDNHYYRPCPSGGYVVVPAPVAAPPVVIMPEAASVPAAYITQPQYLAQETITVNIPSERGGYTAVTLRRSGGGFVGPQGEYYPNNPTVSQLKVLYGR